MAGNFSRKNLAFGQMASTLGDLYNPSSVTGLIHNMLFHNTNTSTETIEVKYNNGSNSYTILKFDLSANDSVFFDFGNEGFIVASAGKLEGNTTTASKVTFKFDGTEES